MSRSHGKCSRDLLHTSSCHKRNLAQSPRGASLGSLCLPPAATSHHTSLGSVLAGRRSPGGGLPLHPRTQPPPPGREGVGAPPGDLSSPRPRPLAVPAASLVHPPLTAAPPRGPTIAPAPGACSFCLSVCFIVCGGETPAREQVRSLPSREVAEPRYSSCQSSRSPHPPFCPSSRVYLSAAASAGSENPGAECEWGGEEPMVGRFLCFWRRTTAKCTWTLPSLWVLYPMRRKPRPRPSSSLPAPVPS